MDKIKSINCDSVQIPLNIQEQLKTLKGDVGEMVMECDDETKRENDILYQEYINNNISTDDFKKSIYNNIWSKYLFLNPILKEDMWKNEMLRFFGDEEVSE